MSKLKDIVGNERKVNKKVIKELEWIEYIIVGENKGV